MEEQHHTDDQSHYEISLTAGQAFVAFVLLLLSLAASFAFGLMIGKGQVDERLVVRRETPVVTEASLMPPKKGEGRIVDLPDEEAEPTDTAPVTETTDTAATAVVEEAPVPAATETAPTETVAEAIPHYAQLLSTGDQKTAETLAARLIEKGFTSAYVERGSTDKGPIFRVRVKFSSEPDARAAEVKLHEFSKDVWITAK
ncbi:MAG TPA: SPOR domain-containing protein [Thermoanaerobaculia bacterium]|nr:SPOR domain-containing protein [Thermoanaerobaculia bacterium]